MAILSGEDAVAADNGGKSVSQRIYEALDNSKKVLVTLCMGLKRDGGAALIDIDQSPWSQELKSSLKPSNKELALEVCRRQKLFSGLESAVGNKLFSIKPKNKPRENLVEWLNTWPLTDQECIKFLTGEAKRVETVLQAALDEGRETALAVQHGAWTGAIPYLRLIHCLVDCDATRMAYLKRHEAMTREELDAVNSPLRPKSGFEVIADKWNDPEFNPSTRISNCHYDFASPINLSYSKVAALIPADAIGVQNRLATIRVTLLRIIDRWEQSGQGDGGRAPDEDGEYPAGWGKLEGRTQEALDNRANFLGGSPSWYLYFWELSDMYQLLVSTLQRFDESIGAANANSSSSVARSRRQNDKVGMDIDTSRSTSDSLDASTSQQQLQSVIQTLIESQTKDRQQERELHDKVQLQERELHLKRRINEVNDTIDGYKIQLAITEKSVFQDLITKKEAELVELKTELMEVESAKRSRMQ